MTTLGPVNPPGTGPIIGHHYLGHPQPATDQRLQQALNFLADEDPDRYLNFEDKIKEIEVYIEFLEKGEPPLPPPAHDANLLIDVKTKVAVHRNWQRHQKTFGSTSLADVTDPNNPVIQPWSNRLVSAEIALRIAKETSELRLTRQTRDDGLVFSHDGGPDHSFLKKLKADVSEDPIEVDPGKNLAWIESQAYNWALNDPALISQWMHPTKGISQKPISLLDDSPWYKGPARAPLTTIGHRPPRSSLPEHLVIRENKINYLLSSAALSLDETDELERLLHYHMPLDLMTKHDAVRQMEVLQDWGFAVDDTALEFADNEFQQHFSQWIAQFRADGVQLMTEPCGSAITRCKEPGVFYVDEGSLGKDREGVLERGAELLKKLRDPLLGLNMFSLAENADFNTLLSHSEPSNIVERYKIQSRLCQLSGVPLSQSRQQQYDRLGQEIECLQRQRKAELATSTDEFHYILPGEIWDPAKATLYLPWQRTDLDTATDVLPPWPTIEPAAAIAEIEQTINQGFQKNLNTQLEVGNQTFVLLLQQVAYPKLRALLIAFSRLCWRETQTMNSREIEAIRVLRPIVHDFWNKWIHGFTVRPGVKQVKVALPCRLSPQLKQPEVLLCHSTDANHGAVCQAKLNKINALISEDWSSKSYAEKVAGFDTLKARMPVEHCFHALTTAPRTPAARTAEDADKAFRFDQWMISKKNLTLKIEKFNKFVHPNDDPTVVYYLGPLPTISELSEVLLDNTRAQITEHFMLRNDPSQKIPNSFEWAGDHLGHLPQLLKDQHSSNSPNPPPEIEAFFDWYMNEVACFNPDNPNTVSDISPLGIAELGEDGIDDADILISKQAKYDAKRQMEVCQAAKARNKQVPASYSFPPKPFIRATNTIVDDTCFATPAPTFTLQPRNISLRKLIRSTEIELNRLLKLFKKPFCTIDIKRPLANKSKTPTTRLYALLPQFMPTEILEKWQQYTYLLKRRKSSEKARKLTPGEIVIQKSFENVFLPWFDTLANQGISISSPYGPGSDRGPGRIYQGDRNVTELCFRDKYLGNLGTDSFLMEITAPILEDQDKEFNDEVKLSQSEIAKVFLTTEVLQPSTQIVAHSYTSFQLYLFATEKEINDLLKDRENLDWAQSERLVDKLRIIMPLRMVDQDKDLQLKDSKARAATTMDPVAICEFWDCWKKWEDDYGSWLKSLPDSIYIDKKLRTDGDHDMLERFAPNRDDELPIRPHREMGLPYPVRKVREDLEDVTHQWKGKWDLGEESWVLIRTALRPLYRQKAQKLRALLEEHMIARLHSFATEPFVLVAETHVLIEVTIDIVYTHFIYQLLEACKSDRTNIKITENIPGQYIFKFDGLMPVDALTTTPEALFELLWSQGSEPNINLMSHKQKFHELTRKLRLGHDFTSDEVAVIESNFRDLPGRRSMMVQLAKYVKLLEARQDLVDGDRENFEKLETSMLWHRLFFDYQDLAAIVGDREIIIDQTRDLLRRQMAGTTRNPSGPPLIPPPSEFEVYEVEVELNNLIVRCKNGTATRDEEKELEYLLIAMLDPREREWQNRLDKYDKKYTTRNGLTASETVEFLSRDISLKQLDFHGLTRLPKHGYRLINGGKSYTAICEITSRARTWKSHTRKWDGSFRYPMTSNYIEDYDLRVLRQYIFALEKRLDDVWTDENGLKDLFFWHDMPQSLQELKVHLDDPNVDPQLDVFGQESDEAFKKGYFTYHYMLWLEGLSPSVLKAMRDKVAVNPLLHDYTPKAERRGVQRASLELALNNLANNQEQHRPGDRFRVVDISGQSFPKPEKEVPISLPLEPWKRPLEQDPFSYTKRMVLYQKSKDEEYKLARERQIAKRYDVLEPPANFLGPFALADGDTYKEVSRQNQLYLASIALRLQDAQLKAPRPLMQHLLNNFSEGLANDVPIDVVPLTGEQLDLLSHLADDSWDEEKQPFDEDADNQTVLQAMTPARRAQFDEFVAEVETLGDQLPLWRAPAAPNDHRQTPYDPSLNPNTSGIRQGTLMTLLNQKRDIQNPPLGHYTSPTVVLFLRIMHRAKHLFYRERNRNAGLHPRVWRIPVTGHPENKYVTKPMLANLPADKIEAGVNFDANGLAYVQYDADGNTGVPILMRNKPELLGRFAYRLGRECRTYMRTVAGPYKPLMDCWREQKDIIVAAVSEMQNITEEDRLTRCPTSALLDQSKNSLKSMAVELHKVAPDLAQQAEWRNPPSTPDDMKDWQAGQILQMQVLEEVSNNWELRFPENEHVWNFAEDRLKDIDVNLGNRTVKVKPRNKQFFSLRRFPVECQTPEMQDLIKKSGPELAEKPKPAPSTLPPTALTRAQKKVQPAASLKPPPKKDRHIRGQQPSFPFGETPYQAAFLSFRMEQDLKDVPEFQPPPRPRSFIPRIFRKRRRNNDDDDDAPAPKRLALPDLPEEWDPNNISPNVKRVQVIEVAKRTPGMPSYEIPEHWYSQAEIQGLQSREQWDLHCQRVQIANQMTEALTGKPVGQLTAVELNKARMELEIDLTLGIMRNLPTPAPTPNPGAAAPGGFRRTRPSLTVETGGTAAGGGVTSGTGGGGGGGGGGENRAASGGRAGASAQTHTPPPQQPPNRSPSLNPAGWQSAPTEQVQLPVFSNGAAMSRATYNSLMANGQDPWELHGPNIALDNAIVDAKAAAALAVNQLQPPVAGATGGGMLVL